MLYFIMDIDKHLTVFFIPLNSSNNCGWILFGYKEILRKSAYLNNYTCMTTHIKTTSVEEFKVFY